MAIIKNDPHKERLDKVITRWLKRHLQRLKAEVDLQNLNSLIEDNEMLAENLQHWAEKERITGERIGRTETAKNLIKLGLLTDEQISAATGLSLKDIQQLRKDVAH